MYRLDMLQPVPDLTPQAGSSAEFDHGELRGFLATAYGAAYRADKISKYIERSRVVVLRSKAGELAAASLIDKTRIAIIAPSADRQKFGDRLGVKLQLLDACHEDGHARWITAGLQYPKVQSALLQAGMSQVNDPVTARNLLDETGFNDQALTHDAAGALIVTSGDRGTRQGYQQHIFAWER